jgi:hypothetical protein
MVYGEQMRNNWQQREIRELVIRLGDCDEAGFPSLCFAASMIFESQFRQVVSSHSLRNLDSRHAKFC